jgi:hypothetical protein
MQSRQLLQMALQLSERASLMLLEDMKDAPLAFPTSKGGNHPLWIVGHLTYSEGMLCWQFARGEKNPVAEWKELFDAGTQPLADAAKYPPYEAVIQKFKEIRKQTMAYLETLTEEDLDKPAKGVPKPFETFFSTVRQCFLMAAMHPMNHRGQVADARRAAGRKPLFM